MNKDEQIAKQYLESKGYKEIEHEPDGKVPPDFRIDKTIAIEVRRLNQHNTDGEQVEGLELLEYKMRGKVEGMLSRINREISADKSFFIFYSFNRPLPAIKEVVNWMRKTLLNYLNHGIETQTTFYFDEFQELKIIISPASERHNDVFLLGGFNDLDAGGFIVAEVHRNLQIVSNEKMRKVENYRHRYPEWWLMLIDRIGHGLCERDVQQLNAIKLEHRWDKIILVPPQNPESGVEVYARLQ